MARTCEYGERGEGKKCRKRARVAIGFHFPFGERLSMVGPPIQVFLDRVTVRFADHDKVNREQGRCPIAIFEAAEARESE